MIAKFTRKDFLEALFMEYYLEHRGFIMVRSVRRGDPKMSTRYFPNMEILAKEHYGEERDVYFGICPRERMKAEKEHIRYLVALWADLDIGAEGHEGKKAYFDVPWQAARAIRSFPRAPSIIVESGRGAHLYWLLKEVEEVTDHEKAEHFLKNINDHLQCDTDTSLDTALRLPETLNSKIPGKPVLCDVKFLNTNFRYTLQDFENLGRRVVVPAGPTAEAPGSRAGVIEGDVSSESVVVEAPTDTSEAASVAMDGSLVLDETIIDELIDDVSMKNVVADPPLSQEPLGIPEASADGNLGGNRGVPKSGPRRTGGGSARPTRLQAGYLEKLSSSRTNVEISLRGSETLINGTLVWSEKGLIGIESGDHIYTIPLSSIAFIKSNAL